jgi:1-acyl-sn-glycerol-3-phosphate acyltransferase
MSGIVAGWRPVTPSEPMMRGYRTALRVLSPIVRRWGRLEVSGVEHLPQSGPVLLVGNHDSYWDPVAIGIAALGRRQIRALAKAELWKVPGLRPVLDSMGQIPIRRGRGDAQALDRAVAELRAGACIGVFPEGTRSLGRTLRARGGLARLAAAVPEAVVVACTVQGTTDIPRFPRRPRVRVRFFSPQAIASADGDARRDLPARLLAEIREQVPRDPAGRRRKAARRSAAAAGAEPPG